MQFIPQLAAQQGVVARAAIEPVGPIPAEQEVVATLPPHGIVGAALAHQRIGAGPADEAAELGQEIPGQEPVRRLAGRHRDAQEKIRGGEAAIIVEVGPDLEAPGLAFHHAPEHVGEAVLDARLRQLDARAGIAFEGEVRRGHVEGDGTAQQQRRRQADAVPARLPGALEVEDQVRRGGRALRAGRIEQEQIVAGPAGEAVGAEPALDRVVPGPARERVVPRPAREAVRGGPAGEHVVPRPAEQRDPCRGGRAAIERDGGPERLRGSIDGE